MEGAEEVVNTVSIMDCFDTIKDAAGACLDWISKSPVLMTVFAGGVIASLAFRFIRKAKKAAR